MPGPAFLRGDAVELRTIEEEDLAFLQATVNDPAVRQGTGFRTPVNAEQEHEWYEEGASSDDTVTLLVCVDGESATDASGNADVEPAGLVSLHPVDHPYGKGEIGIFLAREHWGNGYGTDAARTITDYAFDALRKHRVVARVFEHNTGSQRIWEKLGFRHEATFADAAFVDGEYVDARLYAVLEGEWRTNE